MNYTVQNIENSYYPFGSSMPGRSFTGSSKYRYNFQGQETEQELWGGEASFFKYRISDNRLGRFFSVDPLSASFPWNSSYAFQENKLGLGIELEGAELLSFGSSIYQRKYSGGRSMYLNIIKSNVPKSILSVHGHIMTNSDFSSHGPAGAYNHDQQFNTPTFVSSDYYSKSHEWFGGYDNNPATDLPIRAGQAKPSNTNATGAGAAADAVENFSGVYNNVYGYQAIWNGFGKENDHRKALYKAFSIVAPLYDDVIISSNYNEKVYSEFVDVLNYIVDGTLPGFDGFEVISIGFGKSSLVGTYSKERIEYRLFIIGRGNDILSSEGIEIQTKTEESNKTVK